MRFFPDLHYDAKLLMASRGIRSFAFSYLNVVFAIYLDQLGYTPVMIGIIFSVAYLAGALLTAVWGYLSDRYGRRKILMLLAVLTIISNGIYIFFRIRLPGGGVYCTIRLLRVPEHLAIRAEETTHSFIK